MSYNMIYKHGRTLRRVLLVARRIVFCGGTARFSVTNWLRPAPMVKFSFPKIGGPPRNSIHGRP